MSHPLKETGAGRVAVVGTLNVDHVWRVSALPRPGETVLAVDAIRQWGGKGANQAVAAARQGAKVMMIGAIGDDAEGGLYREHLEREGIATSHVQAFSGVSTGTAHVYVDAAGENQIVVNRGANERLAGPQVGSALEQLLPRLDVIVVQLECPLEPAVEALRRAARRQVRTLLNASPVHGRFPWGEVEIDTVIVNQHECHECFGHRPAELAALSDRRRQELLRARALRHLIVTQGSKPTLRISAEELQTVPAFPVTPVDTVGAGDTFAGALAAQLARGTGWQQAIWHANVAAALSTLTPGAQAGIPTAAQVSDAMRTAPMARLA